MTKQTENKWTGFFFQEGEYFPGWVTPRGWFSCPATEGYDTEEEALEAARHFGKKVKAELRPSLR